MEFMLLSDMRALPQSSRDRPNMFRKPPERAEYTTESEVEESELDQTRHNRCGVLRPTAYSDSDRSVDCTLQGPWLPGTWFSCPFGLV